LKTRVFFDIISKRIGGVSVSISIDRILERLDYYLNKNYYNGAKRHLEYWRNEAIAEGDERAELLIINEQMGLYRKLGMRDEALCCVRDAMQKIDKMDISSQIGAGTTYVNCATVYKAFDKAGQAMPIFEMARQIYERELPPSDKRLGALYNNMALCLTDLSRFEEAYSLYDKAIEVMTIQERGALEVAITHLNIATTIEAEHGYFFEDERVQSRLKIARELIEGEEKRDGYYAFVCEKCAGVFGYYGDIEYEMELKERARRIYEGT
jgi:tetratricopeptide (TPR) repeat protein